MNYGWTFLRWILSDNKSIRFFSAIPLIVLRQECRVPARVFYDPGSMLPCVRDDFNRFLKHRFHIRVVSCSSPNRIIRKIWVGHFWNTWHNQLRRWCRIVASMLGRDAWEMISFLVTRSYQLMQSILRRLVCWKSSRYSMSRRYNAQTEVWALYRRTQRQRRPRYWRTWLWLIWWGHDCWLPDLIALRK